MRSPGLTTNPSSVTIAQVYQDLQEEGVEHPHHVRLAYRNRVGTLIKREVSLQDLNMVDGISISVALMDLTFELTLRHGPSRVMSSPALNSSHEDAWQWACLNPPPPAFQGLRLIPIHNNDHWIVLVEEYSGPTVDR